MATYSTVEDLLTADVAFSRSLDKGKFVQDATDEIDSVIGSRYATPVNMSDSGPVARHSRLLLKRINVHLSTGRMILAVASATEQSSVHAYGARLVRDAVVALNKIADGTVLLVGAPLVEGQIEGQAGPSAYQPDESAVDAFEAFAMGGAIPMPGVPMWQPGTRQ